MENIKQMAQRHKVEIKSLQDSCTHTKHRRVPYMWAPGHFGNDVEMCDECGKILLTYNDPSILDLSEGDVVFSSSSKDSPWDVCDR